MIAMKRVINFHDGEDDNIYVETDDLLMYYIPTEVWETAIVPDGIVDNPIAKATYLLHYTDHFESTLEENK
jgi:hypothetical protein